MHVLGLQEEEIFCKYIAQIAFFPLFHLKLSAISTLLLPHLGSPDHIILPCKIKNRKAALGCEVLRKKTLGRQAFKRRSAALERVKKFLGQRGWKLIFSK